MNGPLGARAGRLGTSGGGRASAVARGALLAIVISVAGGCGAEAWMDSPVSVPTSAMAGDAPYSHEERYHRFQLQAAETIRPTRMPESHPGPTPTLQSVRSTDEIEARQRLDVYCTARTDSLRWFARSIHAHINGISRELRDGNIQAAQSSYDTVQWATEAFSDSANEAVQRCRAITPRLTEHLLTTGSQLSAARLAIRGACTSEYVDRGIECG